MIKGNPTEKNPPRTTSRNGTHRNDVVSRRSRHASAVDHEGAEDLFECSSKHCRSCMAGIVADCVAICCCPCAVVNLLALAFVKVPVSVGKKCLGRRKKKAAAAAKKIQESKRKEEGSLEGGKWRVVDQSGRMLEMEISSEFDVNIDHEQEQEQDEQVEPRLSARFEADRIWLELYQIGHLGFGRVSFTDIQLSS